jgi:hypothetical protein
MHEIAFILLAHENPRVVTERVRTLLEQDARVHIIVHYDGRASAQDFETLTSSFREEPRAHFVTERAVCKWGAFGLVDGVVRALRLAFERNIPADHFALISGSCALIRPVSEFRMFLGNHPDVEFIESEDESWIKDGLRAERYTFRHPFNMQTHQTMFDTSVFIQRRLRIRRRFPSGLTPRFGAQWWCLTRNVCRKIIEWIDSRPRDYDFFRLTWIPDEMFFQTMVYSLTSPSLIYGRSLTYYKFTAVGRPFTFYDAPEDDAHLPQFPFYFMRKVASNAAALREMLRRRAAGRENVELIETYADRLPPRTLGEPVVDMEEKRLAEWNEAKPGQIFWRDQIFNDWPAALGKSRTPFIVLYGPSALTEIAAASLAPDETFTVLGRLFKKDEVDFGPFTSALPGLHAQDHQIRDLDPSLYLARVLARARGVPVFRLAPGEAPRMEGALMSMADVALVVPCLPANMFPPPALSSHRFSREAKAEIAARLFWTLAAADLQNAPWVEAADVAPYGRNRTLIERHIDGRVRARISDVHRQWMTDRLKLAADESEPVALTDLLPTLHWRCAEPFAPDKAQWRDERGGVRVRTRAIFGDVARAVAQRLEEAETALQTLSLQEATETLPVSWRRYFDLLLDDEESDGRASR